MLYGIAANCRPWTSDDDAIVRAEAGKLAAPAIAKRLGRTASAVYKRFGQLGISLKRKWSVFDDARLEMAWGDKMAKVAIEIGRSQNAIYARALHLGLGLGVPDGHERLTAAAERTGYNVRDLRRILDWAGVEIHDGLRKPSDEPLHGHFVCPLEVDDAIARWHATETPQHAAKRFGLSYGEILARLEASGLRLPRRPAGRKQWRIPSVLIEKVMGTNGNRRIAA